MDSIPHHERYIRRCLQLAERGLGKTGLNPLVGCVIVHKNKIIGEGFHEKYGGPHAEVNAINAVAKPELLKESTLYVNLEPCSHYGKTPPCSLLIKQNEIPSVVISLTDPNPLVSGNGIRMLRESGVQVTTGVLEKEAVFLNRRFITNISKKRPWIVLKWAQSRDGFIDKIRKKGDPLQPNWITNHTARMLVHKWRSEEFGIMAGVNTILSDNPGLNVREWSGSSPVRIVIDQNCRIPAGSKILNKDAETWLFSSAFKDEVKDNISFFRWDKEKSLNDFLHFLYSQGCYSLIVEGGAKLFNNFISQDLWDEARVFTGDILFREGVSAPVLPGNPDNAVEFRGNFLHFWYNKPDKNYVYSI